MNSRCLWQMFCEARSRGLKVYPLFNILTYSYRECLCLKLLLLLFSQTANYTNTRITQLLPLVIISPLHNKQDGGNIGIRDPFLSI